MKASQPGEYERFFEVFIGEVLRRSFSMTVGINYQFEGEGEGGDYNVLALTDTSELFYFECKTGKWLNKEDFSNFNKRHLFLRPAASVMVYDQLPSAMKKKLVLMRQVLTEDIRQRKPAITEDSTFQYQDFEAIPSPEREFAYHMNRNLFFCSGKDVKRGIAHCLRYYDGVVKRRT